MSDVFQALQQRFQQLTNARCVWVGFSGGLDSTVLLHQLSRLGLKNLKAVHVNHQLSANAQHWASHCEQQAKQWGVECVIAKVVVKPQGKGLEAAARDARLHVFNGLLEAEDFVLTAHHANDQAETLLFRLVRGAGLKGLAGVQEQRALGVHENAGCLLRPFLNVTRDQILAYAHAHHLEWVEDESNGDSTFDRNFLRNEVVPQLQQRWPKTVERLASSTALLQQSHDLLAEYLSADLQQCKPSSERVGHSIGLEPFSRFSTQKQNHLLRYWLNTLQCRLPSQPQLAEIHKLVAAADDAFPQVSWGDANQGFEGGCSLQRFRGRLYAVPRLSPQAPRTVMIDWDGESNTPLGEGFTLGTVPSVRGLPKGQYTIRFRQGGERCQPEARDKSQTLKKLLQEFGLEPWLRDRVPLVYRGETLVAVGDLWLCKGVAEKGGAALTWSFPSPASNGICPL